MKCNYRRVCFWRLNTKRTAQVFLERTRQISSSLLIFKNCLSLVTLFHKSWAIAYPGTKV